MLLVTKQFLKQLRTAFIDLFFFSCVFCVCYDWYYGEGVFKTNDPLPEVIQVSAETTFTPQYLQELKKHYTRRLCQKELTKG